MRMDIAGKVRWHMAQWLWTLPENLLVSGRSRSAWMGPVVEPLRNESRGAVLPGREDVMTPRKRIDELHLRGGATHHEVGPRHPHKAALEYRGKGAKVERRSRRSQTRRKSG
jgi:hypothetical protein